MKKTGVFFRATLVAGMKALMGDLDHAYPEAVESTHSDP
jgi:hypothetical protein